MSKFGSGNEARIGSHYAKKTTGSKSSLLQYSVPAKVPTRITKENMRSALNEYFSEFVLGDEDAVQNMKAVITEIKNQKWERFFCKTDKCKAKSYTVWADMFIQEKIVLKIHYRHKTSVVYSVIDNNNFNPSSDEMIKNLFEFWKQITE